MVILALAVEMNGDILTPINVVGLIVCLCGITTHVVHKIRTTPARHLSRCDFDSERLEIQKQLIYQDPDDEEEEDVKLDDSDAEKSDSQVLFDILNRHDR